MIRDLYSHSFGGGRKSKYPWDLLVVWKYQRIIFPATRFLKFANTGRDLEISLPSIFVSNGRGFEIEGKNVVGRGGEGKERTGNPRQGHMPVRKVALLEDDDPSTPAGFRPTPLVRAPLTTSRLSPLVLLLHRKVFHYLPSSSYFSSTSSFPRFVFKERINNCPDYGSGFDRVRSWRVWKIEYYRFTDGVAEIFISWKVSILNFKRIDGCSINL